MYMVVPRTDDPMPVCGKRQDSVNHRIFERTLRPSSDHLPHLADGQLAGRDGEVALRVAAAGGFEGRGGRVRLLGRGDVAGGAHAGGGHGGRFLGGSSGVLTSALPLVEASIGWPYWGTFYASMPNISILLFQWLFRDFLALLEDDIPPFISASRRDVHWLVVGATCRDAEADRVDSRLARQKDFLTTPTGRVAWGTVVGLCQAGVCLDVFGCSGSLDGAGSYCETPLLASEMNSLSSISKLLESSRELHVGSWYPRENNNSETPLRELGENNQSIHPSLMMNTAAFHS